MSKALEDAITWVCPYCNKEYTTQSKFSEALKTKERCKHCERKDLDVGTTLEMDGLLTHKDILDRFYVMKPCIDCGKYTKQDIRLKDEKCRCCGGQMGVASTYWSSIRSFNDKRKISLGDRKKMGAKK